MPANDKRKIRYNLEQYGPFSATEAILMESVKKGADRQKMHEILRVISLSAWQEIQNGRANPLEKELITNKEIKKYLEQKTVEKLLNIKNHIGDAPEKALNLIKIIKL